MDLDRYWGDVRRAYKPLARADEQQLCAKLAATRAALEADPDDAAAERALARLRERFVTSALPFAFKCARKYAGAQFRLADAVQTANMALLHAFDKFDPERGFRFLTYSRYWLGAYLGTAKLQARLPVHLPRYLCTAGERGKRSGPYKQAAARALAHPLYLDADDGNADMALGVHRGAAQIVSELDRARLRARVHEALDGLDERSRDILCRRHGLEAPEQTLAEIASEYDLSRERVRQLQIAAHERLREELSDLAC